MTPNRESALTVLHVSSYRFGPSHHPATYRTIVGLARHFRTVVVCGTFPGYFAAGPHEGRAAAVAHSIDLHSGHSTSALRQLEVARPLATTLLERHGRIDAIVGHLSCGERALQLARLLQAPVLSILHRTDANTQLTSPRHRADYERLRGAPAAFYVAVSQNLVDRLLAFGMAPERTRLHHLGLDLERYHVPDRSGRAGPLRIVMAGRFRPSKGQQVALEGFARFAERYREASLRFVGSANRPDQWRLQEQLLASAEAMGLGGRVTFPGEMPVDAVAEEFRRADVAIQPSVFLPEAGQVEGVPNTILEAMATGLPVVATRHGGIPEAVLHERTGLLVDEYDVEGLAAALSRLAADPGLRLAYGREGRRHVGTEFELGCQSERLARHVRSMCEAHASLDPATREEAWRACAPDAAAPAPIPATPGPASAIPGPRCD